MFTGLIESIGEVRSLRKNGEFLELRLGVGESIRDLGQGSSIAANGVCITARRVFDDGFAADLSHETLERTTLGTLCVGDHVNLEQALRADGRLGGHIVQGHVDAVGEIRDFYRSGDEWTLTVGFDNACQSRLVPKGSVAVDGISLTVAGLGEDWFTVAIIPYTLENTTLQYCRSGDRVNLEFDMIAKYVERLVEPYLHKIEDALS